MRTISRGGRFLILADPIFSPWSDHGKTVEFFRRQGQLPLVKDYLASVQKTNILEVNDALNTLLIEEEDFEALKHSITTYDNFDQVDRVDVTLF